MIDETRHLAVKQRDEMDEIREIDQIAHERLAVAEDGGRAIMMRGRSLGRSQISQLGGDA